MKMTTKMITKLKMTMIMTLKMIMKAIMIMMMKKKMVMIMMMIMPMMLKMIMMAIMTMIAITQIKDSFKFNNPQIRILMHPKKSKSVPMH